MTLKYQDTGDLVNRFLRTTSAWADSVKSSYLVKKNSSPSKKLVTTKLTFDTQIYRLPRLGENQFRRMISLLRRHINYQLKYYLIIILII